MITEYSSNDEIVVNVIRNAIRQLKARRGMFEVKDDLVEVVHGLEYAMQWCLHLPLDRSKHTYYQDFEDFK